MMHLREIFTLVCGGVLFAIRYVLPWDLGFRVHIMFRTSTVTPRKLRPGASGRWT